MEGAKCFEAYLQPLPSATKRAATEQLGGEGGTGRAFLAAVGAALALAWTCRVVLQRQQRRQTGADKGGAAAGRGSKRGGAPPAAAVEPLERLAPNVKGDGFEWKDPTNIYRPGPPGVFKCPLHFPWQLGFLRGFLWARGGRVTAPFGDIRPGQ